MEEKQKAELLTNAGMLEKAYKMYLQQEARKETKAPQKLKSKKKRRALARKAHKSRVRNK